MLEDLPRTIESDPKSDPVRVMLICTGVDVCLGGHETFARECFDGLRGRAGLEIELIKGSGRDGGGEKRIRCILRTTRLAKFLAWISRRDEYGVEQVSALIPVIRRIRADRPQVVFLSDEPLQRRLFKLRDRIGVPFRILFSNGAPMSGPFGCADRVQQVTPMYAKIAVEHGEPAGKQSMVPYGIAVPEGDPIAIDRGKVAEIRGRLGLPLDRKVVVSVGMLSSFHKRMDYVISEIASLPQPRPYLVMLGRADSSTPEIIRMGEEKLGRENFRAVSVPYREVADYYRAADVFALASLTEGFGRVYLEALIEGLPCLVHDNPVTRFVLDAEGTFADLSKTGAMAERLAEMLGRERTAQEMIRRRQSVRERFDWSRLAADYIQMFRDCAAS